MDTKFESLLTQIIEPIVSRAVSAEFEKQKNTKTLPEYLNIQRASELSGYAVASLYQMHSKGQLPFACKNGGRLMFKTAELILWIEGQSK